jgi:putative MATE family efflux protein
MEYANPLGERKISRLLLQFSIPATVGMMVNTIYNIVDRIYIGNSPDMGSNGIGGITLVFPIMIILMSMGVLFGIGGATLFSIRLGEQKKDEAENILGNAFVMLMIVGVTFTVLGQIFLKPILLLFGASNDLLPYATEYARVIFFGALFQVVGMGMNNFIRADGSPTIAMLTMIIGAGANIVLDPILIFGLKMGMAGAALATILSQCLSGTWVFLYFIGKRSRNKLKLKYMRLRASIVGKIASLGLPSSLMQLANSFLNMALNKSLITYGGDTAISAMGIINSIQMLLIMPVIGINQGAQPIISFNFGAKKYSRIKETVKLAIIAATVIVSLGYIAVRLFPMQMVSLFNSEPSILGFGKEALLTWMLLLPVVGFQVVAASFFQAIGRYKSSMFLTLTRQIIFLIPAVLLFSKLWGVAGLLYAAPVADFFSTLLTGVWFFFGIRKLGREPAGKTESAC